MSGGFTPSKVAELLNLEPSDAIKIKKVEFAKGKKDTRIPFVNFSVFNTKSRRFELPLMRDNQIRMSYGIEDISAMERDRVEYTWDDKKKERKIRVAKRDFPNLIAFMNKCVPHIQASYKAEITEKAEDIEGYFHRKETPELQSKNRDWPAKWRSESTIDPDTGKKGPGKGYVDADGNPDPRIELRLKFAGNPDDKWPAKFPIESMRGRPQETEFLDYKSVRLDEARVVYDPLKVDGESVTPFNVHKVLARGAIIHEIDYFFKSGGWSEMSGGSPFLHLWVTRCVVELPQSNDLDNTASPEQMEQIKEIMRLRALRNGESNQKNDPPPKEKTLTGDAKTDFLNGL